MRTIIVIATLAVSGCVQGITYVRNNGIETSFSSAGTVAQVSMCLARNAEGQGFQIRLLPTGYNEEAIVYPPADGPMKPTAVIDIAPISTGSTSTIYMNRWIISPNLVEQALVKGC
jgi:hypothetical protein